VARALGDSLICLALWIVPAATIQLSLGANDTLSQIAIFFSTMVMVTFGGHAALACVAQQAVETYYDSARPVSARCGDGLCCNSGLCFENGP
jgi:chromate transporter